MRAFTASAVLTAVLTASLLLGGCAATESEAAPASSAPSPQATASPEPITGAPGDSLSAEEAKQLNGQRGTLRPYEMNDGSHVLIDVEQPLPPAVKEEIAQNLGSAGNDSGSALSKLNQESSTGKTIIMVRKLHAGDGNGNAVFTWVAASYASGFPMGIMGGSADSVVSQVQPWLNSQRDPAQYEVIVVNN
ncbi:hypothetical protein ACFWHT_00360 [Microbacterium sp. NPDC058342]|uniref:hypothetical protein n=1 Tax=Microbacterium sp. NPDC058342 TaxID=3346454 RepID=UPI00365CCC29